MKSLVITIFLIIIVQLTGCSKMAYHFADWVIVRSIDSYLDLNAEQKLIVKKQVRHHLARMEIEEYSQYINLIEALSNGFMTGLTSANFDNLAGQYHQQLGDSLQKVAPDIGELFASLTPQQISHLEKKLIEDNDERYEHIKLSPKKRQRARKELLQDKLNYWFGHISKQQQKQIHSWHKAIPDIDHVWHETGEENINRFITLLRNTNDANAVSGFIVEFWINRQSFFNADLERRYQQQKSDVKGLILKIDNILTDKQRLKAKSRFDYFIKLLNAIKRDEKIEVTSNHTLQYH